jgi:hypothetical protein
MLYQAADRIPEPDLADAAWAEGLTTRRRRRRGVVIGLIVALVVAIVALIGVEVGSGGKADIAPPTTPPSKPADYITPSGQIAGIDYWIAPPSGSERFLDRLETPLGDRLRLPDNVHSLSEQPIDRIAAVVLAHRGGDYEPVILGADSSWSRAGVQLVAIAGGPPLSSGAVSPDGQIVAFPQPGELVTVNAATAEVAQYSLPSEDLRSVSWLDDAQHVLVSGPGVAYRVLVGEAGSEVTAVIRIGGAENPEAVTAPFRLESGAVLRYLDNGQWAVDSPLSLPVRTWVGQTFSSNGAAARVFVARDLPQVPTKDTQPQVVAAISTLRTLPSHLLVLGEPDLGLPRTPRSGGDRIYPREPGCCAVLGWYDHDTPLVEVEGWVLAWNLSSGRVRRVTELAVDRLAIGPGIRG